MSDCQITCITKPHPQSTHDHITQVGNPSVPWFLAVPDVIHRIESGIDTFYVLDPRTNKRANVGVVRAAGHNPHIRTYADGVWNDNLLSLNQCPV